MAMRFVVQRRFGDSHGFLSSRPAAPADLGPNLPGRSEHLYMQAEIEEWHAELMRLRQLDGRDTRGKPLTRPASASLRRRPASATLPRRQSSAATLPPPQPRSRDTSPAPETEATQLWTPSGSTSRPRSASTSRTAPALPQDVGSRPPSLPSYATMTQAALERAALVPQRPAESMPRPSSANARRRHSSPAPLAATLPPTRPSSAYGARRPACVCGRGPCICCAPFKF